ncbi:hypothetical protein SAMN05421747_10769 [Parapedobacter composti]|uniref:Uncharacterized protein n=1 Tax=Parapedobacter composti TaxID=623281 RepID=A0A1I1HRC5_9SPHI|nr:hypothetical protein [Parapedobacter composti]SFC26365.1 hypothetical protein SAMN05421747_10769 [Parapedobacter composti]
MAKIKQKKLKAENFRYVIKRVIKNPMIYLDNFFRYEASIDHWMRDISFTVNAGAYPAMACPDAVENGYHCRQLIEQVEVAYVIFKQCGLKKQKEPLAFFKSRDDYYTYASRGEYSFDGQINPADTLSKFFSFQPMKKWYATLDDLMLGLTWGRAPNYEQFGDKIVAIHELLLRLAQALYVIHRQGGLPLQVPSYVIAQPTDKFEGKMPLSRLGELIHGIADKRHAEAAAELEPIFEKAELWDNHMNGEDGTEVVDGDGDEGSSKADEERGSTSNVAQE